MTHPKPLRPEAHAVFAESKMGKATLFESPRLLVGLNCFRPGQSHALHAHASMDKLYHVVQGTGLLLLETEEHALAPGLTAIAPAGVSHGIRNEGASDLVLLTVLAPGPGC